VFPAELVAKARSLLARLEAERLKLVTAESCTGGLIVGLLTEIPGSSAVVERGFVTYSNEAKTQLLGVPAEMIVSHGAVSAQVAAAMATGALKASRAAVAVSVTGVAGPGGGTAAKPVGLVYLGLASIHHGEDARRLKLGAIGRSEIRMASVEAALDLVSDALDRKLG